MTHYVNTKRLAVVWAVLVLATCVSFALGSHHGVAADSARVGTAIALAVAFVKAHVIGMEFMELRNAPRALVGAFNAWIIVVGAALIGLYVAG